MPITSTAYEERFVGGEHEYVFQCTCRRCKKDTEIVVAAPDLYKYNQGVFAQEAFPYLSPAERELFCISSICGPCFDEMFPPEDD